MKTLLSFITAPALIILTYTFYYMYSTSGKVLTSIVTTSVLLASNTTYSQTLLAIFSKGDKPNGFLFLALTGLALFMALAVHELGHLVAGLVQGFRFELFVVGLLCFKRVALPYRHT